MQTLPTHPWSSAFARRTHGVSGELAAILELAGGTDLISFAGGLPDPQTFPVAVLRDLAEPLLSGDAAVALQYSPTPGLPGLRDAFADRLADTQGRRPQAGELMVTSGTIDALGLLARAMLDPGDVAAVESPTYLGAIDGFRGFEADVRGIPVDEDGIDTDELERLFNAEPMPSLWSLAPDIVVQAGTTSKTFFPGVRLGWAVGPTEAIAQMVVAKQNSDQCAGALGQRLLEEYLRGGHMDRRLRLSNAL